MKTSLFLIASLFSIHLSAQIYHPFQTSSTNPNWSIANWVGPGYTPWFSWYEINTDTVIGAQTYGKVDHYYSGSSFIYEGALREIGQQIFFIPKDSVNEMLIYDFSKQQGDTLFNIWCYNFNAWKQDTLVINTDDSLLINGNYYNNYYLQDLCSGCGGIQWIESIGSTKDLLRQTTFPSVSGDYYLTCFHNNQGTYFTTSEPFGWTGSTTCYLEVESYKYEEMKVYPNPATAYLKIPHNDLAQGAAYEILNTNGEVVQTGIFQSEVISVNGLTSGLYLIRITAEKQGFLGKFIKNE